MVEAERLLDGLTSSETPSPVAEIIPTLYAVTRPGVVAEL